MSNRHHRHRHQRSTQCRYPSLIPTHRGRLPSKINLAGSHQDRQLHFLDRPHLRQRVQVVPCTHRKPPRSHKTVTTRRPIHQGHNASRSNGSSATSHHNQDQRNLCLDRAYYKALHQGHRPISHPLPQRKILHHACIPCIIKHHPGQDFPITELSPPPCHSKPYHVPTPEERPQR